MQASSNPTLFYIGVGIAVIIVVALIVALARRARSESLRRRFGPEYERTVQKTGDRTAAERELADREARVRKLHLQPLPAGAKARYSEEWHTIQGRFVDEPRESLVSADHLVVSVMRDRGYPADDFDQRLADLSPDHPRVLDNYRAAHDITVRSERNAASTEDLRRAMVHYRALFDDLLDNKTSSKDKTSSKESVKA
ncbi:MAG TPA: hypothetical protein VME66_02315 [Candidatus Acidoferrales bacterium]|nr:hypothetical protein [Candidatus Acidoferrales bacterium]